MKFIIRRSGADRPGWLFALALAIIAAGDQVGAQQLFSFTYQGRLSQNGFSANGTYDATFRLFNSGTNGVQAGTTLTNSGIGISNGLFTTMLDFGSAPFSGTNLWLEIAFRTNGGGAFVALSPRQQLTPSPYAIFAPSAGNAATAGTAASAGTAGSFSGTLGGDVTGTQGATLVSGVGGQSASNVAAGVIAANGATSTNTANSLVKRDASGNFAASAITSTSISGNGAGLTGLNASNVSSGTLSDARLSANVALLNGNNAFTGSNSLSGAMVATNTANILAGSFRGSLVGAATSATNFTGPLNGEVVGSQNTTVVSSVGGQSAASVASGAVAANAATNANVPATLVKRDSSGNFSAGTITATLGGNAATATTATNFAGPLFGDVTGNQGATVVSTVGGQAAANVASGASVANGATNANIANSIVKRDGTGGFSAGVVTLASVAGDGSGLTNLNGANLIGGSVGTAQLAAGAVGSNQIAAGAALANLQVSGQIGVASGGMVLSSQSNASNLLNAGYAKIGVMLTAENWAPGAGFNAPGPRAFATAVWTGSKVIVWGGINGSALATGATFDPLANSWTPLPTNNAPSPRYYHSAIWTGSEMIIWGGNSGTSQLNTGARYNPASNVWTTTSTNGAPAPRDEMHDAVWTGTEMIVWGGFDGVDAVATGGRYNPTNDSWISMTTNGAPHASYSHASAWTGTEMLIWGGGYGNVTVLNTGARYNPSNDTWTAVSPINAPTGRYIPYFVWTGKELIVWGGRTGSGITSLNDGGRYNPTSDTWVSMASSGAPSSRSDYGLHGVWTGKEMIIWGGQPSSGSPANDGGIYDPAADTWRSTTTVSAPGGRSNFGLAWTGDAMFVSGGFNGATLLGDTYLYTPPRTLFLYMKP